MGPQTEAPGGPTVTLTLVAMAPDVATTRPVPWPTAVMSPLVEIVATAASGALNVMAWLLTSLPN